MVSPFFQPGEEILPTPSTGKIHPVTRPGFCGPPWKPVPPAVGNRRVDAGEPTGPAGQ